MTTVTVVRALARFSRLTRPIGQQYLQVCTSSCGNCNKGWTVSKRTNSGTTAKVCQAGTKASVGMALKDFNAGRFDEHLEHDNHERHFRKHASMYTTATTLDDINSGHERAPPMDTGVMTLPDPDNLEHFRKDVSISTTALADIDSRQDSTPPIGTHAMPHPIWSTEEMENVMISHRPPEGMIDWMAFYAVQTLRTGFDIVSGFTRGVRTEGKWIQRIVFLETVAAVPGMVAAMTRHLHSLRRFRRDYGWIHTLLEEAENERMHLMTALELKTPSWLFRMGVVGTQGIFVTLFSISYLLSPTFCHRFVGYLEEEAVKTYTKCVQDIESGPLQHWQTQASPDVAIRYWQLAEDATMKDVILAIRADEAHHRLVNHTLASMKKTDYNPYKPGE